MKKLVEKMSQVSPKTMIQFSVFMFLLCLLVLYLECCHPTGACLRCDLSWKGDINLFHYTGFNPHPTLRAPNGGSHYQRATFALCKECWQKLTPEERLPYYKKLWKCWEGSSQEEWEEIKEAVLAGR